MYCVSNNYLFIFKNIKKISFLEKNKKIKFLNLTYNYNFKFNNIFFKNYLVFLYKNKNSYFYNFSKLNQKLSLNFFKNINLFFENSNNLLLVDLNYKNILPFINYVYGFKSLSFHKSFFFLTKKNLSKNNFISLYKIFLKNYNISALVVLEYKFFKKFFFMLTKLEVPIYSLLNEEDYNAYSDYFFYCSYLNVELIKLLVYNNIISIFFYHYNKKLIMYKHFYIKKFKNIIKIK